MPPPTPSTSCYWPGSRHDRHRSAPVGPRRRLGWLWAIITAGTLANGLRLRARIDALQEIADDTPSTTVDPDHVFLTATGVELDDATRGAASRYARHHDLDVLDLVPGDLGTDQLLDLARQVDPATYATSPLALGRGARQATLVHRAVLERAGLTADDQLDPVSYLRVTTELKKFAAKTSDLAVAAGLSAVPEDLSQRRAYLTAQYSKAMPVVAAVPAVQAALLGAGLWLSPGWGAAALASFWAQPYLVTNGTGSARGTSPGSGDHPAAARGMGHDSHPMTRTKTEAPADPTSDQAAEYRELLAGGLGPFFEPRRQTCPLCDETSLSVRVRMPISCSPNPASSSSTNVAAATTSSRTPGFRSRASTSTTATSTTAWAATWPRWSSAPTTAPTGGGSTWWPPMPSRSAGLTSEPVTAISAWSPPTCCPIPGSKDSTSATASSRPSGTGGSSEPTSACSPSWPTSSWRPYDAVSMHHYLEHTRDPAEELDAARKVLEPGGHLLIEVPDPECRTGRLLGWMWGPWFQPQHQHFVSVGNLATMLKDRGFTRLVAWERRPAHQPADLAFASLLLLNRIAGPPPQPWVGPRRFRTRVRRAVCFPGAGAAGGGRPHHRPTDRPGRPSASRRSQHLPDAGPRSPSRRPVLRTPATGAGRTASGEQVVRS